MSLEGTPPAKVLENMASSFLLVNDNSYVAVYYQLS